MGLNPCSGGEGSGGGLHLRVQRQGEASPTLPPDAIDSVDHSEFKLVLPFIALNGSHRNF